MKWSRGMARKKKPLIIPDNVPATKTVAIHKSMWKTLLEYELKKIIRENFPGKYFVEVAYGNDPPALVIGLFTSEPKRLSEMMWKDEDFDEAIAQDQIKAVAQKFMAMAFILRG